METKFRKLVSRSFLFRLYLLRSLPMGFIAGIRVKELDDMSCTTVIRYKWLTQNPFHSMYFACQAMAAEMSTGLPVLDVVYGSNPPVSMLITGNMAQYFKKARGKIIFRCVSGDAIREAVKKSSATGEGVVIDLRSEGKDETGDIVSVFTFTWSIKVRTQ